MDSTSKRETCSFYLKKKNRFCSLERAPGSPFCHLHSAELDVGNGDVSECERVPCPIDPTHTVPIRKLKAHVERKCPALKLRPDRKLPYVRDDVEALSEKKEPTESLPLSTLLQHFDGPFLLSFRKRVEDVVENIGSKWIQGESLESTGATRMFEDGSGKSKHQPQLEGILHALSTRLAHDVDRDCVPVIEMGCGRAELSQYLAEMGGFKHFVLIDRKTCAHPRDKHIRIVSTDTKVMRHKIDLRHIVVSGLPSITELQTEKGREVSYIACSKHLYVHMNCVLQCSFMMID
jgi:tRNA:m4X modification enzyme